MYMASASNTSSEDDPLVGGEQRGRNGGGKSRHASSSSSGPSKPLIVAIFVALLAAIVVYLCFWPKTSTLTTPGQVVVEPDSAEPTSSVVHRPICEYSKASSGAVFESGTQTSMTEPSMQWKDLACFPVETEGTSSSWFRKKNNNPLQLNHYQAPDAILQVNFSHRVFADRPPIYGFGGAFTEASALNYKRLSQAGKDAVMELLFGQSGLGYSIGRIHINSCDFSIKSYSFDDVNGDFALDFFDTGVHHDVESGMVDMALRATSLTRQAWPANNADNAERKDGDFLLFASPWSPPSWMKNPTWQDKAGADHAAKMTYSTEPTCLRDGVGEASPYAAAWALYFSKFLTAYQNLGLPFWAVTVQNEPEFPAPWEACAYTPETETEFVANHLGPRLREDHPDVKLLVFDHNKDHINTWTDMLLNETLGAKEYIDGIAYHWYAGGMDRLLDGALGIPNMHRLQDHLQKANAKQQLVLGSESCHCPTTGYAGGDLRVIWDRAERYAHTVLADLAAGSNGWVEWNLLLDTIGGPNHLGNLCETTLLAAPHRAKDAPEGTSPLPKFEKSEPFGDSIIGDDRTREELNALGFPAEYLDVGVVVQPIYYYMGHISRYVRPGSFAVAGLVTAASGNHQDGGRIFRPKGSVSMGGGENGLARHGIELTMWPCEGSTRQQFHWDLDQKKHITVKGHDWLGRPTRSCVARFVDEELMGLRLTDCDGPDTGIFNVLPLADPDDPRYKIELLNHPVATEPQCVVINELANAGGAYGPRGGAQAALGSCENDDESAKWFIDPEFGEARSSYFGEEVCLTTGWPFLQMGAFVSPGGKKTVVLLNEARSSANFALQDEEDLVMTGAIPPRSIQTYVLK